MDSVGEGEGGKIWENGIETCKISCMKRVASPGSTHDTGCLVSGCKESACNAGDQGSIPGSERSPREGNDYPLQISCLENSMTEKPRWL